MAPGSRSPFPCPRLLSRPGLPFMAASEAGHSSCPYCAERESQTPYRIAPGRLHARGPMWSLAEDVARPRSVTMARLVRWEAFGPARVAGPLVTPLFACARTDMSPSDC